jgi:AraC-like DNA-binding protein
VINRVAVSYSFFDSSLYIDTADEAAETFLHRFIKNGNRDFSFVRFIPQWESLSPPSYFEYVCTEFLRPAPRGNYLIIGFMERFLNALVGEYQYDIEWNDHFRNQKIEFEEIRSCLEKEYPRVTMKSLMQKYGCGVNHINRLFKSHTGLTYKAYLQNLRLEKARNLLLTTGFPISEVACLVGYKNVSHFYKIFREKFHILPNKIRRLG